MHLRWATPILVLVLFSWGCAFSAVNRPVVNRYHSQFAHQQTFALPSPQSLEAAASAVQAMGWEVQAITAELGQLRTKARAVTIPEICDCGTWNMSPVRGTAESSLLIRVADADGGQSTVSIENVCATNFAGQNLYGATTRRESYQCASRGAIEREFWTTMERIVQARATAN